MSSHNLPSLKEQREQAKKNIAIRRAAHISSKISNPEAHQQSLAKVKADTHYTQPHLFNGDKPLARSCSTPMAATSSAVIPSWSYKAKKSVRKSKKSVRKSKKSVRKSKKSVRKSKKSVRKSKKSVRKSKKSLKK